MGLKSWMTLITAYIPDFLNISCFQFDLKVVHTYVNISCYGHFCTGCSSPLSLIFVNGDGLEGLKPASETSK